MEKVCPYHRRSVGWTNRGKEMVLGIGGGSSERRRQVVVRKMRPCRSVRVCMCVAIEEVRCAAGQERARSAMGAVTRNGAGKKEDLLVIN